VDPLVIVFGLCVGALIGVTGMGGGTLMTPLLIVALGVKPVTAVGTDIAYAAVTKTVGAWRHLRSGTVDVALSSCMAIGSVPAAIAGVYALHRLERAAGVHFDGAVIAALAAVLMLTGTITLARLLLVGDPDARERRSVPLTRRNRVVAVVIGAFVGFVLGVTSAGSGALIGVALILVFRLVPLRVVGTDVFHAAMLLWAAAIAHIAAGNVDYALAGTLMLGSVPGVWLGSSIAPRVPTGHLRAVLALVMLGSGLALMTKAGLAVPPALIAAVPLAVALLVGAGHFNNMARSAKLDLSRYGMRVSQNTTCGPPDADRTRGVAQ
jgi:uncharacterized membrane protein YfcA